MHAKVTAAQSLLAALDCRRKSAKKSVERQQARDPARCGGSRMESAICPALFDPPCPCSPPGHETLPGPAGGGIPWCTGSGTGPAICRPRRPARTSRFSRARARGQSKECRPSGGSYPCPKSHWSGLQRRRGRGVEVQLGGEGCRLHLAQVNTAKTTKNDSSKTWCEAVVGR